MRKFISLKSRWKFGNFFDYLIYLFLETGEGWERGKETSMHKRNMASGWLPLPRPDLGNGLQPRHVSWKGIELVIFRFVRWCPTHRATPVSVRLCGGFNRTLSSLNFLKVYGKVTLWPTPKNNFNYFWLTIHVVFFEIKGSEIK